MRRCREGVAVFQKEILKGRRKENKQEKVLPKRESSRRKAKENSSLKKTMKLLENDEDDVQDIAFSDSDDDATW